MNTHKVDVCIVGGGPAGMVLGLLLAHHGVKTLVLEKHHDFAREYRGEVLMPRFMQMFRQIGLEEWLDALPHLKLKQGEIYFREKKIGAFDFSKAAPDAPYALWMPQTQLLNALHDRGKSLPNLEVWFDADAKTLVEEDGVSGVVVQKGTEKVTVSSRVTVGADGRFSTVFRQAGLALEYEDYKFDLLWFSIPKPKDYDNTFKVLLSMKRSYLLLPKFPDSIQVGILVGAGELSRMKTQGIDVLKTELKTANPLFHEFADKLHDFTEFHPLQARLHMVRNWAKKGLLLIGDSAHCCSPAGAIGVSMAVGTAIVAADVIREALQKESGVLSYDALSEVQRLREWDVRNVHKIQRRLTGGLLANILPIRFLLPLIVTLLGKTPIFLKFQRQLMSLAGPLPVEPGLGFREANS